ncbi:RrF2 family transcriptional regulator [Paenibacillus elgii]|uniref:RrF2 family transcriptional regulator n=1 Tax=Paenibacillus elgii TaxID=189691 RepID=UPI0013D7EDFF|nr:Rrf2 family transcriptional regulator [Paenibacillus elgii]
MKVSTKGEYALRALLVLAQNPNQVIAISELSHKTLVTVQYLEKILLQLKKMNYVDSKRGLQGGYFLKSPPENIFIGEVIRYLEGPLAPMSCASVTAYEPCELEETCLLKPLWMLVREVVAYVLDQTTLDDLIKGNLQKSSFQIY